MSQLQFFLKPQELLQILENIHQKQSIAIIFRRFISETFDSGFRILNQGENACDIYLSGGYSQIYVSISGLPTNTKDWDFLNRNANDLVLLEGGRLRDNILEMFRARLISKSSNAKYIFKLLKKSITSISDSQGLHTKTKQFYKKIYYCCDLLSYELRLSLDEDKESFIYIE